LTTVTLFFVALKNLAIHVIGGAAEVGACWSWSAASASSSSSHFASSAAVGSLQSSGAAWWRCNGTLCNFTGTAHSAPLFKFCFSFFYRNNVAKKSTLLDIP
jgi:hypothetical protein